MSLVVFEGFLAGFSMRNLGLASFCELCVSSVKIVVFAGADRYRMDKLKLLHPSSFHLPRIPYKPHNVLAKTLRKFFLRARIATGFTEVPGFGRKEGS